MSVFADTTKTKKPLDELNSLVASNQASQQRIATYQEQQSRIPLIAPIIKEGRSSWRSTPSPATDAAVRAKQTLGGQIAGEKAALETTVPALRRLTGQVRDQTAQVRMATTNAAADNLLESVGAKPVASVTPVKPLVRSSFTDVSGSSRSSEAPAAARSPAVPSQQVGEPAPGGGGAALRTDGVTVGRGKFGERTFTATGQTVAAAQTASGGTGGSVTAQNFGTSPGTGVATGTQPLSRPGVASTFGQSVLSMADDNQIVLRRPDVAVRGVDAMSEQYARIDDRAARQKVMSDIDSQVFALGLSAQRGGRDGRASKDAIGGLLSRKADLAASAERGSAEAIQNRQEGDITLANTNLEQQGALRRAEIDANNGFNIATMQDQTDRARIGAELTRPQYVQDAQGNYVSLANGKSNAVVDAEGKPLRGAVAGKNTTAELQAAMADTTQKLLEQVNPEGEGGYSPAQIQQAQTAARQIHGMGDDAPATPPAGAPPGAQRAPDGNWYVKKDGQYFKVTN